MSAWIITLLTLGVSILITIICVVLKKYITGCIDQKFHERSEIFKAEVATVAIIRQKKLMIALENRVAVVEKLWELVQASIENRNKSTLAKLDKFVKEKELYLNDSMVKVVNNFTCKDNILSDEITSHRSKMLEEIQKCINV